MTEAGVQPQRTERADVDNLDAVLAQFKREGFVVFEDAIEPEFVATLRERYMEALAAKVRRMGLAPVEDLEGRRVRNDRVQVDFTPAGGNHDLNRWNMHLPSRAPFLDGRVIANPAAMGLIDALLGPDCVLPIIASDTPYPGSGFQNIHQDSRFLRLWVNAPLVDFREDFAPLEVWPRSHLPNPEDASTFTSAPYDMDAGRMAALSRSLPSKRLLLRAGSILVRDHRLMHRGTANQSDAPRPMVTLYYQLGPRRVPHRAVADAVARIALASRERVRHGGDPRALEKANHVGRLVESVSATDRDYRREIPSDTWSGLPERARRLLRFARVDGRPAGPPTFEPSLRTSLLLGVQLVHLPWRALARHLATR